jgi:hypothetical protein
MALKNTALRQLSLIWFTFWSSLVHGIIMCTQAILDPQEYGHLIGDLTALFIAVFLLGWLTPRASVKELIH